ncbi:hypothetical protein SAMN06265222_1101 [Neorhodopirellula lusitana]|uniref:Uncharacterized protein n=1 Tax=Neorhodopirellula lusitana TaxID=445327 RepID=A0ABY1QFJ6_9BACT|nr:hypothetical protein SAMN06265222_1101 [Neorhodopirellula lusitana]
MKVSRILDANLNECGAGGPVIDGSLWVLKMTGVFNANKSTLIDGTNKQRHGLLPTCCLLILTRQGGRILYLGIPSVFAR